MNTDKMDLPIRDQKIKLLWQGVGDGTVEGFEVNGMLAIPGPDGVTYVRREDAIEFFGFAALTPHTAPAEAAAPQAAPVVPYNTSQFSNLTNQAHGYGNIAPSANTAQPSETASAVQAGVAMREPSEQEIDAVIEKTCGKFRVLDGYDYEDVHRIVRAVLAALSPQAPAAVGEPSQTIFDLHFEGEPSLLKMVEAYYRPHFSKGKARELAEWFKAGILAQLAASPPATQDPSLSPALHRDNFQFEAFHDDLQKSVSLRGANWVAVSKATGVSTTTLSRMKEGRRPDAASIAALSAWAGINPAKYFFAAANQAAALDAPKCRMLTEAELLSAGWGYGHTVDVRAIQRKFAEVNNLTIAAKPGEPS